jgi:predicted secreted acid phosphatase
MRNGIAALFVLSALAAVPASAQCPSVPEPHTPPAPAPLNIDKMKEVLRDYHDTQYAQDMAAVYAIAQKYVEKRAGEVKSPAVIMDIDETVLSNWGNLVADDFGFFRNGNCDNLPDGPCGFDAWILRSEAVAFPSALTFFNAVRDKGVAIIFITNRWAKQRQATLWNLDRAGFEGWTKLVTRSDKDDFPTVQAFKSAARARIEADEKYTLIANIGDQLSDLEQQPGITAGKAECSFKLPNPFYFIK